MKISILVPIYNVEGYIARCAESLFSQTYADIEYIFVNDCSPDKSVDVLKQTLNKYQYRKQSVRIINHAHNRGLAAARNTAIEAATGEYITFVDSDDFLDTDCLQKVVATIIHDNADVVLFGFKHIFSNKSISEHQVSNDTHSEYIKSLIERRKQPCVCGGIYKKTLFSNNGIRFIDNLNFGEDYVVKPRLLHNASKIVFLDDCFYNYTHYNPLSYTNIFKDKDIDDQLKALNILTDYFKDIYPQSLAIASLRIKAELFIKWGTNDGKKASYARIKQISELSSYNSYLPLKYRLTLVIARFNSRTLVAWYAKFGSYIKHILK